MNPKQRRGLILMITAALLAVVVLVGVIAFVMDVESQRGPQTEVYVAKEDIAAFETITPEMLERKAVPDRYMSEQMITSQEQFAGQKASSDISAGAFLQTDMLEPTSSLQDGQREISVSFDGAAGVSGRVSPGDRVDVIASFAKQRENDQGDQAYKRADIPYNISGIIVANAYVVSVGQPVNPQAQVGSADESGAEAGSVPVTFAVSVEEAGRLSYAESFAISMRIQRIGNNETGTQVEDGDKSFDDQDLQDVL